MMNVYEVSKYIEKENSLLFLGKNDEIEIMEKEEVKTLIENTTSLTGDAIKEVVWRIKWDFDILNVKNPDEIQFDKKSRLLDSYQRKGIESIKDLLLLLIKEAESFIISDIDSQKRKLVSIRKERIDVNLRLKELTSFVKNS